MSSNTTDVRLDRFPGIEVRKVPFEFPDDLDPVWHSGHREWSHMINGASLAMPYLEPFLIATLREAASEIDDPQVLDEIAGFVGQEGQHFRTHRRYNEILKANGYPELAEVEEWMKQSYARIRDRRSLAFRLAYSAGFESMTLGVTRWLVGRSGRVVRRQRHSRGQLRALAHGRRGRAQARRVRRLPGGGRHVLATRARCLHRFAPRLPALSTRRQDDADRRRAVAQPTLAAPSLAANGRVLRRRVARRAAQCAPPPRPSRRNPTPSGSRGGSPATPPTPTATRPR